jgi:hypothetical protein
MENKTGSSVASGEKKIIFFICPISWMPQLILDFSTDYTRAHNMARANRNKSKKVLTSTTTASKYMPKRPIICIN